MMDFNRVSLEIGGVVGTIRLNHPEVLNALSHEMIEGLQQALDAVAESDSPVRCVVLTGTGRAFSSGANLQGRLTRGATGKATSAAAGVLLEAMLHPLLRRLRNLNVPFITAVNGAAAGAGMSLALFGDLILCARSAYFLQAFRRVGLVPDGGSTWLLPRLIGRARALELSLLGERLPADTALAWGLVNRVYDDEALLPETVKLAGELAAGPTLTLGMTRKLYWESEGNSFEEQIDLEQRTQRLAGTTDDYREGVKAFLEKRAAAFQGK